MFPITLRGCPCALLVLLLATPRPWAEETALDESKTEETAPEIQARKYTSTRDKRDIAGIPEFQDGVATSYGITKRLSLTSDLHPGCRSTTRSRR